MCRELNNIQGFSKDSIIFQNENRNNSGELGKTNEKVTSYNAQGDKKDP